MSTKRYQEPIDPISGGHLHYVQCTYTRTIQQVSEMVAFGDLKVAGGELVEGAGIYHMYNYIYIHIPYLYCGSIMFFGLPETGRSMCPTPRTRRNGLTSLPKKCRRSRAKKCSA